MHRPHTPTLLYQPDLHHQKIIQVASKCDMLLLYLQYGVYDSPVPASFIRSAAPIMGRAKFPAPRWSPHANTYTPNECLSIMLTSEIGQWRNGHSPSWHTRHWTTGTDLQSWMWLWSLHSIVNSGTCSEPNMKPITACGPKAFSKASQPRYSVGITKPTSLHRTFLAILGFPVENPEGKCPK